MSWTIVISLITDASGLSIRVDKLFKPHYESKTEGFITGDEAFRIRDPMGILKPIFPVEITLANELKSLKTFEGVSTTVLKSRTF